jgi:lipoic acid synthetase
VLKFIAVSRVRTKTGIMLGLGETEEEVLETMDDARKCGVEVFTIGQYLQPTKRHLEVKDFITPDQFEKYRIIGLEKGFKYVESSPLVRSSYHAEKHVI